MSQGSSPEGGASEDDYVVDEITGQRLPADETITLHGYRVGAEGKQILLDRLQAGESLTNEPERPGGLRRCGCYILDSLIVGIVTACLGNAVLWNLLGSGGMGMGMGRTPAGGTALALQGVVQFVATGIWLAYFAIQHAYSGQTFGKRVGRLRVVNMDLTPITPGTAWLRGLYLFGPGMLTAALMIPASLAPTPGAILVSIMSIAAGIYVLVNFIVGLADSDYQRTLHDRWAGTRVIWEQ